MPPQLGSSSDPDSSATPGGAVTSPTGPTLPVTFLAYARDASATTSTDDLAISDVAGTIDDVYRRRWRRSDPWPLPLEAVLERFASHVGDPLLRVEFQAAIDVAAATEHTYEGVPIITFPWLARRAAEHTPGEPSEARVWWADARACYAKGVLEAAAIIDIDGPTEHGARLRLPMELEALRAATETGLVRFYQVVPS